MPFATNQLLSLSSHMAFDHIPTPSVYARRCPPRRGGAATARCAAQCVPCGKAVKRPFRILPVGGRQRRQAERAVSQAF